MSSDLADIRRSLWDLLLDLRSGEVETDDVGAAMISALDSLIDLAKLESFLGGAREPVNSERPGVERSSTQELRELLGEEA